MKIELQSIDIELDDLFMKFGIPGPGLCRNGIKYIHENVQDKTHGK